MTWIIFIFICTLDIKLERLLDFTSTTWKKDHYHMRTDIRIPAGYDKMQTSLWGGSHDRVPEETSSMPHSFWCEEQV